MSVSIFFEFRFRSCATDALPVVPVVADALRRGEELADPRTVVGAARACV